jgi:ABC-type sugar transport system substrate-binding protein
MRDKNKNNKDHRHKYQLDNTKKNDEICLGKPHIGGDFWTPVNEFCEEINYNNGINQARYEDDGTDNGGITKLETGINQKNGSFIKCQCFNPIQVL